jgi:TPP-dependent pyruvate/acetoin dehydrogenase alpha subunit
LLNVKKWLTATENRELIAGVDQQLEEDRDFAVASPMPEPESAAGGVYCEDGCHQIKPRYAIPKFRTGSTHMQRTEAAVHLK